MPRVGYLVGGEKYLYDEVMRRAKQEGGFHGFPAPVWAAMQRQTHRSDGFYLTPSAAGVCLRQRLLQASEDYWVIPEKLWAIMDGVSWHGLFEDGTEHQEMSLSMPLAVPWAPPGADITKTLRMPVVELRGRLDHYDPEMKRLTDYKRTASFGYRTKGGAWVKKDYPEPHHEVQTNLYALLLRHHGYEVDSIQVFYFQSGNDCQRKLVDVPVWDYHTQIDTAVDLALPIALARDTGQLPPCNCRYGPGFLDRNLCEEVTDDAWRADGWRRLLDRG